MLGSTEKMRFYEKGSKYGGYMVENQEQVQEQKEEEKLVKIQQCVNCVFGRGMVME